MRLRDIDAEISFDLWMKPLVTGNSPTSKDVGMADLYLDRSGMDYTLSSSGRSWRMKIRDSGQKADLDFHLKRGCAHLAEIEQVARDESALVKITFFNGKAIEVGDVGVGIDDHIVETAKRNGFKFRTTQDLCKLLEEKCNLKVGDKNFFVFLAGRSADEDFEENDDDSSLESRMAPQKELRQFSLYGETVCIPVEKRKVSKSKSVFFATKAIFKDNRKKEGAIRLARGYVKFSDYTKTGEISNLAAAAMKKLINTEDSYLKQWDKYGEAEGKILLARARNIGRIKFGRAEKTTRGIKFFCQSIPKGLTQGDELEITDKEPPYVANRDLTWEEYMRILEGEFRSQIKPDSVHAKVLDIGEKSIELSEQVVPEGNKFLVLSINGEKVQIERRMQARRAILEARCANPLLGQIIEENGELPDIKRVTKIKPMTPFVRDKIFKHNPTLRQIEAIEVALNTPDIALIQGPPGTGKTTVIAAIVERLNEEYGKKDSVRGKILVSGFQHDAVENIASRLSINSLPTVKFGKRSEESGFTQSSVDEKIDKWCDNLASAIRSKNPQIDKTKEQVELSELITMYSVCPSRGNTRSLIKRVLDLPRSVIDKSVVDKAEEILDSIEEKQEANDQKMLSLIRALRVTESSFRDDGEKRAADLLVHLENEPMEGLSALKEAASWRNGKPLSFLSNLKKLKEDLLHKYMPIPEFKIDKPRSDVIELVANVSKILRRNLASENKRDCILAEFLHEIEDNPHGIRYALEDYNLVYASTTQGAAGKDILRAKSRGVAPREKPRIIYDTVIIDEAARVSPRDLLIPLSQAEKRIILVGDHRQLPHIIDEEVARALENPENDDSSMCASRDFLQESMFGYLFKRLKKLEAKDGIKRTVTLGAQYRTHPVLGKFASDNFYEEHGEGYKSPLDDSHFKHWLRGIENKAAVWIDVPNSLGGESRLPSGSRKREIEAERLAEYASDWIDSDEGSKLSFGIISFYKAQVDAIFKSLMKYGITERAQDNTLQICRNYRFFDDGRERLRMGTVDAFQGMEFDVVFLSMVRSCSMDKKYNSDCEKTQQRLFGHLMSLNRLCVSMSRQKRVLIVAGDAGFVQTKIAERAVPALKNFYDLCKKQGKIYE